MFFLTGFYSLVSVLTAQILKVDKSHLSGDSSDYFTGVADAAFALNNRSSTADVENIYVGFRHHVDVVYIGDKAATVFIGGVNYFKIGNGPVISNGSVHMREIFLRSAFLSPEFFGQLQYDESRNMKARELVGGGLRFNFIQGENSLHMGVGAFHEYERWDRTDVVILKNLWKMNSFLGAEIDLNKHVQINAIVYYQTGRDAAIDAYRSRLSGHLELKDKISNHFKVKLITDFFMDNRPIIPLNTFVYEAYVGIEYVLN